MSDDQWTMLSPLRVRVTMERALRMEAERQGLMITGARRQALAQWLERMARERREDAMSWDAALQKTQGDLAELGIAITAGNASTAYRASHQWMSGNKKLWQSLGWPEPEGLSVPHRVMTVAFPLMSRADRNKDWVQVK